MNSTSFELLMRPRPRSVWSRPSARHLVSAMFVGLVLAGGVLGCASFDPDVDRFACATDEDCGEGWVCGGQTFVNGRTTAFCVEASRATVGIELEVANSAFPCGAPPSGTTIEVETRVARVESSTAALTDADFEPVVACDAADAAPQGGAQACCLGDPRGFSTGENRLLCLVPAAGTAQIGVRRIYRVGGSVLLRVDGRGAVPTDVPKVVDARRGVFDDDIAEIDLKGYLDNPLLRAANTNRCGGRALQRAQLCESTATLTDTCACTSPTATPRECPEGFFCLDPGDALTTPTCWPSNYLPTGAECVVDTVDNIPDSKLACASNICQGGRCN